MSTQRGTLHTILANSAVVVLVDTDTDRVGGFARVLTDGVVYGYVADVMVRPDLRGIGLGRQLMTAVLAHPALAGVTSVELTCQPEMDAFYGRFGFLEPANGSHVLRRRLSDAPTA